MSRGHGGRAPATQTVKHKIKLAMAQPYFDLLKKLVSAQEHLPAGLVCKHFFSGAALYFNGRICASLSPKGLAFKLPQDRCDHLIMKGLAESLRYFDNSPIKKGYVLFSNTQELSDSDKANYLSECLGRAA